EQAGGLGRGRAELRLGDRDLALPLRAGQVEQAFRPLRLRDEVRVYDHDPRPLGEGLPRAVLRLRPRRVGSGLATLVGFVHPLAREPDGAERLVVPMDVAPRSTGLLRQLDD